jgi:diaminopimelate epimerase
MIDDREGRFEPRRETIAALCAAHRGIGADGLILIRPSERGQFRMRYYNRDGGEAAMCGNGARCAALFAHRSGIAGRTMTFETGSGVAEAEILQSGVAIGIGDVGGLRLNLALAAANEPVHFAEAGVPHAALLTEDAVSYPDERFLSLARSIRNDPAFQPAGANVNLVTVHRSDRLSYRTYERGVERETLACGTGAVAVAVITSHLGITRSPVACETSGGDTLEVAFERVDGGAAACRLTGPAVETFSGTFSLARIDGS